MKGYCKPVKDHHTSSFSVRSLSQSSPDMLFMDKFTYSPHQTACTRHSPFSQISSKIYIMMNNNFNTRLGVPILDNDQKLTRLNFSSGNFFFIYFQILVFYCIFHSLEHCISQNVRDPNEPQRFCSALKNMTYLVSITKCYSTMDQLNRDNTTQGWLILKP